MLLIHQVGSVKIGEIIRYTITYTPSQDRILPSPEKLHVRIRNTTAIALRAAFVHGPYTLSVASYPSHFDPNKKFENTRRYGTPQFEPMLKAGGSWECELVVPDNIRQSAGVGSHGGFGKAPEHDTESASWIIEVTSQVVFSASASVGFEVVVARDYKSLSISQSLPVVSGQSQVPRPGNVTDLQQSVGAKDGHHAAQPKGVFSRAIHVKVEDTASLWNTPRLPGWDDEGGARLTGTSNKDQPVESMVQTGDSETAEETPIRNQKKVHLVILTHGLHSNLGADMLFMKESIDKAAKTARVDAKARKARKREEDVTGSTDDVSSTDNDDYEEMIVRGYSGNAAKTEKGIKYLGKRLARYVLSLTYPDQPFIPIGKGAGDGLTEGFLIHEVDETQLKRSHKHSDMVKDTIPDDLKKHRRPYKVTSISFVGHSLGGLVQTYAVAYIQKHSPDFFDLIKPINFIALASPFLGLSNENPLYVKFALDFGLVGRTGKDLGLTWRAPTIARNGWGAIVSNLGETAHKKVYGESRPESKPLLRILPTGPAHIALKKFRNRTVYSNVVNDGIVPLRTSCLLFLDWQGLGRVEKARREAGLVETMVGFGWAELTGTNMAAPKQRPRLTANNRVDSDTSTAAEEDSQKVPQPDDNTMDEDDRASLRSLPTPFSNDATPEAASSQEPSTQGPLSGFFNLFRNNDAPKPQQVSAKQRKMLRRGQTIHFNDATNTPASSNSDVSKGSKGSKVTSGQELEGVADSVAAPPKTTIFESAGDLLNPQRPEIEYIIDPSHRPRAIFHDRVYHPADIPQPPLKKRTTSSLMRRSASKTPTMNSQQSASSDTSSTYQNYKHEDPTDTTKDYDDTANTNPHKRSDEVIDGSNMRVEEKIARGYHRDLAWRKVLVKLEPDAHNNIIVRRMFVNAHGWPVIKHLVDAHFSDSATARTRTEDEHLGERALDMNQPPDKHGGETKTVSVPDPEKSTVDTSTVDSEAAEARDEVTDLPKMQESEDSFASQPSLKAADSITWSERDWIDSENESIPDTEEAKKTESQGQTPMANKEEADTPTWNWTEKIVGKSATEPRDIKGDYMTREIVQHKSNTNIMI